MIVDSMSDIEIKASLEKELYSHWNNVVEFKKNFRKLCLKRSIFPYQHIYKFKSKSGNLFYVNFCAEKRSMHDKPIYSISAIYQKTEGYYEAALTLTNSMVIYPPHFFNRYRERILKSNTSILETIENHIKRNWGNEIAVVNEEYKSVLYAFEKEDKNENIDIISASTDGYSFGTKKNNIIIIKTIISEEMLHEDQKEIFKELKISLEKNILGYTSKI